MLSFCWFACFSAFTAFFPLLSSNHNIIHFIYEWHVELKWSVWSYGDGVYFIIFQALGEPGCVVNGLSVVGFAPNQTKFVFSTSLSGVRTSGTHVDEIWYWSKDLSMDSLRVFHKSVRKLRKGMVIKEFHIRRQVIFSRVHSRCLFIFSLVFEPTLCTFGYGPLELCGIVLIFLVMKSTSEKKLMIEKIRWPLMAILDLFTFLALPVSSLYGLLGMMTIISIITFFTSSLCCILNSWYSRVDFVC